MSKQVSFYVPFTKSKLSEASYYGISCAAAVVAVTLFGRIAPDDFGVFDKALITLFYVTGGDPWPEALPRVNEDGTANWVVAGFVMVFTIMVVWIILEVNRK